MSKREYDLELVKQLEYDYLLANCGLPRRMQKEPMLSPSVNDLEAFKYLNEIKKDIVSFVEDGESLYIYSERYGNGKTSWAVKLMLAYMDAIAIGNQYRVRAIFMNVGTYLQKLKENINYRDEDFEILDVNLRKADLVIWDDIATNKLTEFEHAKLFGHLDARLFAGKANIFTSNVDGDTLANIIGERLKSRVWNNSDVVTFVGDDRRGRK